MAQFSGQGFASGASAGAGVGSFAGPFGAAIGGVVGGVAGAFTLGNRQRFQVPDISGELARVRALYEQARVQARANIKQEAAETRGQLAGNLATRGLLRAPVSENVFGRLREATSRDIATSEASIGAQEAGAISSLLSALLGARTQSQAGNVGLAQARTKDISGALGSVGGTLLNIGLNRPGGGGQTPMAPSPGMTGGGGLNLPAPGPSGAFAATLRKLLAGRK